MTILLQVLLKFLCLPMANFNGANSCVISFLQLYRSVANIFSYEFNQTALNEIFIVMTHHPFPSMPSGSLLGQKRQQTHIWPGSRFRGRSMQNMSDPYLLAKAVPDNPCLLERRIFVKSIRKDIIRHIITKVTNEQTEPC